MIETPGTGANSPHSGPATRVLYIVGPWRCGTTVLSNVLGGTPGLFAAGEVISLWSRLAIPEWLCGCGQPLRERPVWGQVISRLALDTGHDDAGRTFREIIRAIRTVRLPWLLTGSGRRRLFPASIRRPVGAVYEALGEVTGASVLVDTSKIPSYGRLLQMIPSLDVFVLHVVRDPRAVAHSWRRHKPHRCAEGADTSLALPRLGPGRSALGWLAANAESELLWGRDSSARYRRLRYEDFVADPTGAVQEVLSAIGVHGPRPALRGRTARLVTNHSVAGNPNRHGDRQIELREDRAWLDEMSPIDRALVATLTAPLLRRYGYHRKRIPGGVALGADT